MNSSEPPAFDASATRWVFFGLLGLALAGLAAFSLLKPGAVPPPADIASDPFLVRGREVYLERCVSCHGTTGQGDGPIARTLSGPPPRRFAAEAWKHGDRPEDVLKVIAQGVKDTSMAAWRGVLSPEDTRAVAGYVYRLAGRPVPDTLRHAEP